MSMNKRNKSDNVEPAHNWISEKTSKAHQNRTGQSNKVTKETSWRIPKKNIQKDKKPAKNPQDGQSGANSKKRKSCDDVETKHAASTSKIGYNGDKSIVTKPNDANAERKKLKALRRKKKSKESIPLSVDMKSTLSEGSIQTKKGTHNMNLVDKMISKSMKETTHVVTESKKRVFTPETSKARSNRSIEQNHKMSAQSRLISKRKQFEVAAKKALNSMVAGNASNFLMENEKQETVKIVHGAKKTNANSSESCAISVTTRVRNRVKRHLKEYKEKVAELNVSESVKDDSSMCLDEEMDWEPFEQEDMIEHIKKMRKDCGGVEELSKDIAVCSNADMEIIQDKNDLILVFDTNVFISCLPFIKEIRDTCVPGLGLPIIFIPWRVLQELDHLKSSDIKPLQVSAIRAIRFLNENFSSRHPRVNGQSFEDRSSTKEESGSCPDDEILHACLNIKRKDNSKIVVLITNDKNLETKAIVSGVEAFSKDRFMKEKLRDSNRRVSDFNASSKTRNITLKNDMAYCRLKGALKRFMEQLLEVELESAFNKDWRKIVVKKPPWTITDMFECLIKHWRSVFNFIFKRDVLALVHDLKDNFEKVDKGEITVITDIAQVSKELLTRMRIFVSDEKPYSKILTETLSEIEMWAESKNSLNAENREEGQTSLPVSPVPSSSHEPPAMCNPQFDIALCKDKVKNLFQIIWDRVKAFFFRVSELAAANGMNNPDAVYEVKTQFPHVIRNVQELVEIVEKLLSLGPEDASHANQIILHFTNFLVGLNVFQIDPVELNNLPGYIGLFCGDNDGRIVLYTLVNDLKQFAMGMMDGMKVLERL